MGNGTFAPGKKQDIDVNALVDATAKQHGGFGQGSNGRGIVQSNWTMNYGEYLLATALISSEFGGKVGKITKRGGKFMLGHALADAATDALGIEGGWEQGIEFGGGAISAFAFKEDSKLGKFTVGLIVNKDAIGERQIEALKGSFGEFIDNAKREYRKLDELKLTLMEEWKTGKYVPLGGEDDIGRVIDDPEFKGRYASARSPKITAGKAKALTDGLKKELMANGELMMIYDESRLGAVFRGIESDLTGLTLSGDYQNTIRNMVRSKLKTALRAEMPDELFRAKIVTILEGIADENKMLGKGTAEWVGDRLVNGLSKEKMLSRGVIADEIKLGSKEVGGEVAAGAYKRPGTLRTWLRNWKKALAIVAIGVATYLFVDGNAFSSSPRAESGERGQVRPLTTGIPKLDDMIDDKEGDDVERNRLKSSLHIVLWGKRSSGQVVPGVGLFQDSDTGYILNSLGVDGAERLGKKIFDRMDDSEFREGVKDAFTNNEFVAADIRSFYFNQDNPIVAATFNALAEMQIESPSLGLFQGMDTREIELKFVRYLLPGMQDDFRRSDFYTKIKKKERMEEMGGIIREFTPFNTKIDREEMGTRYEKTKETMKTIVENAYDKLMDEGFVDSVTAEHHKLEEEMVAKHKEDANDASFESRDEELKTYYKPIVSATIHAVAEAIIENPELEILKDDITFDELENRFARYMLPEMQEKFRETELYGTMKQDHDRMLEDRTDAFNKERPGVLEYVKGVGAELEDIVLIKDVVGTEQLTGVNDLTHSSPSTRPEPMDVQLKQGVTAISFTCTITDEGKAEKTRAGSFIGYVYPFAFGDTMNPKMVVSGVPHMRAYIRDEKVAVVFDPDTKKDFVEDNYKVSAEVGKPFGVLVMLDRDAGTWSIHVESQYVVNKGPEAMTEVASGEFDTGKYVKDGK
ncbi:MAG: hypothetical protein ABIG39_06020, partial [Candidatus Micrarchaeota archaeon]